MLLVVVDGGGGGADDACTGSLVRGAAGFEPPGRAEGKGRKGVEMFLCPRHDHLWL